MHEADTEPVAIGSLRVMDVVVALRAPSAAYRAAFAQKVAYLELPDYRFAESQPPEPPGGLVLLDQAPSSEVSGPPLLLKLGVRGLAWNHADVLPYVGYRVAEAILQQRAQATMRATVVAKEGQALMLLGTPHAGKTTLAIELCQRFGFGFVGNGLAIVGLRGPDLIVFAATPWLKLRRAAISAHHPHFTHLLAATADPTVADTVIAPEAMGLAVAEAPLPVRASLWISVRGDSMPPTAVTRRPSRRTRLALYEDASRFLMGLGAPVLLSDEQTFPFIPSLDSVERAAARADLVAAIGSTRFIHCVGPLEAVARTAASMF